MRLREPMLSDRMSDQEFLSAVCWDPTEAANFLIHWWRRSPADAVTFFVFWLARLEREVDWRNSYLPSALRSTAEPNRPLVGAAGSVSLIQLRQFLALLQEEHAFLAAVLPPWLDRLLYIHELFPDFDLHLSPSGVRQQRAEAERRRQIEEQASYEANKSNIEAMQAAERIREAERLRVEEQKRQEESDRHAEIDRQEAEERLRRNGVRKLMLEELSSLPLIERLRHMIFAGLPVTAYPLNPTEMNSDILDQLSPAERTILLHVIRDMHGSPWKKLAKLITENGDLTDESDALELT